MCKGRKDALARWSRCSVCERPWRRKRRGRFGGVRRASNGLGSSARVGTARGLIAGRLRHRGLLDRSGTCAVEVVAELYTCAKAARGDRWEHGTHSTKRLRINISACDRINERRLMTRLWKSTTEGRLPRQKAIRPEKPNALRTFVKRYFCHFFKFLGRPSTANSDATP